MIAVTACDGTECKAEISVEAGIIDDIGEGWSRVEVSTRAGVEQLDFCPACSEWVLPALHRVMPDGVDLQ